MPTTVVNLSHGESFDVYIGRAGHGHDGFFGNPHPVDKPCLMCKGDVHKRGNALALYRSYFAERIEFDPEFRRRVLMLRGKKLGCFCSPRECHGHVIAAWVDNHETLGPHSV